MNKVSKTLILLTLPVVFLLFQEAAYAQRNPLTQNKTYRLSPEYKNKQYTKYQAQEQKQNQIVYEENSDITSELYTIKIISPAEDEKVDLYFNLIGQARPNSTIDIVPLSGIGGSGLAPDSSNIPGAITIKADEKGFFKLHYGFPIKVPFMKMQYKLRIIAIDPDGKKSFPKILTVTVKDKLTQ